MVLQPLVVVAACLALTGWAHASAECSENPCFIGSGTQIVDGTVRWTLAFSPIYLNGLLTIGRNGMLIIDPGVDVLCVDDAEIVVNGVLRAEGQPLLPVGPASAWVWWEKS